jgi:1-acyl-sn-glycerol-3-phosphate acyltransferase
MDALITLWSSTVLAAAGVRVKVEGGSTEWLNRTDLVGIIIYNHTSNLDPFLINTICSAHAPKYVGKKNLFMIPVLGWLFAMCGMVPINRGDPEKARATMNERVSSIMKKWGRNVAISPEGTRSADGHLRLPFKKGVYHLQDQTKVPLKPVVIKGAYELWPRGQIFTACGEVTVTFLPPQMQVESDMNATRIKTQQDYVEILAKQAAEKHASPLSLMGAVSCISQLLLCSAFYAAVTWLFYAVMQSLSLGAFYNSLLLLATTATASLYIHKFA